MRGMTTIERAQHLQDIHTIYGGPLYEIRQFRKQADALMAEAHVTTALALIQVCSELFETYRRSSRMTLADADRQRLRAVANGVVQEARR